MAETTEAHQNGYLAEPTADGQMDSVPSNKPWIDHENHETSYLRIPSGVEY